MATIVLRDLHDNLFVPWLLKKARLPPLARLYCRAQDRFFRHRTMLGQGEWETRLAADGFGPVETATITSQGVTRWWDALLPLAMPSMIASSLGLKRRWAMSGAARRFILRQLENSEDGKANLVVVARKPIGPCPVGESK